MAIAYDELDRRIDTLCTALRNLTYLSDGLPYQVTVYKGAFDAGYRLLGNAGVFVSRMGLPDIDYGMAGDPAEVTMEIAVVAVTSYPGDAEEMEMLVNRLSANVLRALFANVQVTGANGWRDGIVEGSDAVRFRDESSRAFEVEAFSFRIVFEADMS